eukprot:COSAG01_NODE_545_length_15679_cov_68.030167_9_plen_129_part_00
MQVPFRRYIEEMITVPQTLDSLGNETYLNPAAPTHTSVCLMGGAWMWAPQRPRLRDGRHLRISSRVHAAGAGSLARVRGWCVYHPRYYLFGSNQGKRFPELLTAYRLPPVSEQHGRVAQLRTTLSPTN